MEYWLHDQQFCNELRNILRTRDISSVVDFSDWRALVTFETHLDTLILAAATQVKKASSLQELKNGVSNGIVLFGTKIKVSQSFVDEAIILSDIFNIDEILAAELLIYADHTLTSFNIPKLTRGLAAVLVFTKARRCVAEALLLLFEADDGRSWSYDLPEELALTISSFVTRMVNAKLIDKLLDFLNSTTPQQNLEALQRCGGIGTPRHRQLVIQNVNKTYESLADCIFVYSAQHSLSSISFIHLMSVVRSISLTSSPAISNTNGTLSSENEATVKSSHLKKFQASLFMACLWNYDCSSLSSLDSTILEDVGLRSETLGLMGSADGLKTIQREICDFSWKSSELQSIAQMAWAICIRVLSQSQLAQFGVMEGFTDDEEALFESALQMKSLIHLKQVLVTMRWFQEKQFFVHRIHILFTNMILSMPFKLKDLRAAAEEEIRIASDFQRRGVEPTIDINLHYWYLLDVMSEFYGSDPLNLELNREYWCVPLDSKTDRQLNYQPTQRQAQLYKFLRNCAEVHAPLLYFAYLKLLHGMVGQSAATAQQCFAMLKSNSQSGAVQLSWDHFFLALRQYEATLLAEPHAEIPRDDLSGLQLWLKLCRLIAGLDSSCALSFCEISSWNCLDSMFGLVTCLIPKQFKSEIYLCLSSFAKSPELSPLFWQKLHSTGVIASNASGLKKEMLELEVPSGIYTITRAFLEMLGSLFENCPLSHFPEDDVFMKSLIDFVVDDVFLKMPERHIESEQEKWKIANSCLTAIWSMLKRFDKVTPVNTAKSPSCTLMQKLLSNASFVDLLMQTLHGGISELEQFNTDADVDSPESVVNAVTLKTLKVLCFALSNQPVFMEIMKLTNASTLVSGIDVLLMDVNAATGQADHLPTILKFLCHFVQLPVHSYYVVRILRSLCVTSFVQLRLLRYFNVNENDSARVRHCFVECLEVGFSIAHYLPDAVFDDPVTESTSDEVFQVETSKHIVSFLVDSLKLSGVNYAYYLLGFDCSRMSSSVLENPGVNRAPKTCLHAIITSIDQSSSRLSSLNQLSGQLLEKALHVIYLLAANGETGHLLLRFLRAGYDFVPAQFNRWINFIVEMHTTEELDLFLPSLSWLLELVAIEWQNLNKSQQRTQLTQLASALFSESDHGSIDPKLDMSKSQLQPSQIEQSYFATSFRSVPKKHAMRNKRQMLMLLVCLPATDSLPDELFDKLDYFDSHKLAQILAVCTQKIPTGYSQCDVTMLHKLMYQELGALPGTGLAGHQGAIEREMTVILDRATKYNHAQRSAFARLKSLNSWCTTIQATLSSNLTTTNEVNQWFSASLFNQQTSLDICFSRENQIQLLVESIVTMLKKALGEELLPPALPPLASTALSAISFLRKLISAQSEASVAVDILDRTASTTVTAVRPDLSRISLMDAGGDRSSTNNFLVLAESQIHLIGKLILQWLTRPGMRDARVKCSMYACLLHLCYIGNTNCLEPSDINLTTDNGQAELTLVENILNQRENVSDQCHGWLQENAGQLLPLLISDSCDGTDLCKALALSCLAAVMKVDAFYASDQINEQLISDGSLRHLLDSLLIEDSKLSDLLTKLDASIRPMYVFGARMSMFCALASNQHGAMMLLEHHALLKLASMQCFGVVPSDLFTPNPVPDAISLGSRYVNVFSGALRLCLTITNSLGSINKQAAIEILQFVIAHFDAVACILRSAHNVISDGQLRMIALLTAVLAQTGTRDDLSELNASLELFAQSEYCMNQLLSLASSFTNIDDVVSLVCPGNSRPQMSTASISRLSSIPRKTNITPSRAKVELSVCEIIQSILSYTVRIALQSSTDGNFNCFLSPVIGRKSATQNNLTLGWLVLLLRSAVQQLQSVLDRLGYVRKLANKLSENASVNLNETSFTGDDYRILLCDDGELVRIAGSDASITEDHTVIENTLLQLSAQQKNVLAAKKLKQSGEYLMNQKDVLQVIIEQGLYLLWGHLNSYLTVPMADEENNSPVYRFSAAKRTPMRQMQEPAQVIEPSSRSQLSGPPAPTAMINLLKEELPASLDEQFLNQLQKIGKNLYVEGDESNYIDTFVQLISRLIQFNLTK